MGVTHSSILKNSICSVNVLANIPLLKAFPSISRKLACRDIFRSRLLNDEWYSMTRTGAPKDRGGRLYLNCARTDPEFPRSSICQIGNFCRGKAQVEGTYREH